MRWIVVAPWRGVRLLTCAALALLLAAASDAFGAPLCSDAASPELAPSLIDLQQALGALMGSPVSCPQPDGEGNLVQVMTTGVAVARANGMSVFASGERHWALTAQGLQTWTGNWHNGLYPPPMPAPEQGQPAPAQPAPASVEAVTVVQAPQDASGTVVVQDPDGSMLAVEMESGCPGLVAAPGDHLFLRSGGPHPDLILVQQHQTCPVAEMHAAAGD